ncbi:MAG: hypothetical protein A2X93_06560 [Deltaproteobacteria bacterium GWC2_56_8]|nr:MAG: hypothetical protein A2X93_06560 [Deltaproteobacteria bacterium GWC2_56_8]
MRDRWYGDKRDLVKWGVLSQLASTFGAVKILQIAYYRQDTWDSLEIDGQQYPLPGDVIKHFRNVHNVTNLETPARINVIGIPFGRVNRIQYTQGIVTAIKSCGSERCVVFLDPDTGLEPKAAVGRQHVRESELATIWNGMRPGDVLVFYQHKIRNMNPWIEPKRVQFERALGLGCGEAKLAWGPAIVRDVAFFYCQKSAGHSATGANDIVR